MDGYTIYIYTEKPTASLLYTAGHICNNIIGCGCMVTTYRSGEHGIDINYSDTDIPGALAIRPSGLLEDPMSHRHIEPVAGTWRGLPTLFHDGRGDLGFDLFAAVFFCISRLEEYGSTALDSHGRYLPTASIAHRNGLLQRPIVDEWCAQLRCVLKERNVQASFRPPRMKNIVTIDIDHPFKYRNKGLLRPLFGAARDIARGDMAQLHERAAVLAGAKGDPYWCFDYILEQLEGMAHDTRFFVLRGKRGRFDRKYLGHSRKYDNLITRLAGRFEVGIHPSYRSSFDADGIMAETHELENLTHLPVTSCRLHFLRVRIPETYTMLERLGFTDDYSLAYSPMTGFRAGTAVPFKFFDAAGDRVTGITVHPTCAMDVTLKNSLHLSPAEAATKLHDLRAKVEATGGEFITLFHNSSLGEDCEWRGWRTVFESTMDDQRQNKQS